MEINTGHRDWGPKEPETKKRVLRTQWPKDPRTRVPEDWGPRTQRPGDLRTRDLSIATQGPEDWGSKDLGNWGPGTQRPENPRTGTLGYKDLRIRDPRAHNHEDCVTLQLLLPKYSYRQSLQAQNHGHVLYVVAVYMALFIAENAISHYPLSSLILRVVVLQSQTFTPKPRESAFTVNWFVD